MVRQNGIFDKTLTENIFAMVGLHDQISEGSVTRQGLDIQISSHYDIFGRMIPWCMFCNYENVYPF